MYDKDACAEQVVENLSRLITREMTEVASEERYPGGDPDRSDELIARGSEIIKALTSMRTDFEYLMSGKLRS